MCPACTETIVVSAAARQERMRPILHVFDSACFVLRGQLWIHVPLLLVKPGFVEPHDAAA